MMFGHFSYLVYMLIFTFIPIGILWWKNFKFLRKNIKIVLITVFIGIIYQIIVDPFAESWGAWFFTEEKILNILMLNFPVENLIFIILISIAISSAVLTFINYQETGKLNRFFKRK